MLGGNLSSRPFYNERGVTLALGVAALIVILLTAFNATRLVQLSSQRRQLAAAIAADRASAATARERTAATRRTVDETALTELAGATREANDLIDRRTFSWTELFAAIERTLPADVRLLRVSPRADRGVFKVSFAVSARHFDDVDAFIDALVRTGAFRDIVPVAQQLQDDGSYAATIDATYAPAPSSSGDTAPASDATPASGATTPARQPRAAGGTGR
ncbi:MAG TPA: hypothetical protein VG538_13390 [Vicinamibacterales bacterium]|jgi:hypothetical protein|nr:hypothetical protein [Vicinamibacterales bacterium]